MFPADHEIPRPTRAGIGDPAATRQLPTGRPYSGDIVGATLVVTPDTEGNALCERRVSRSPIVRHPGRSDYAPQAFHPDHRQHLLGSDVSYEEKGEFEITGPCADRSRKDSHLL